MSLPNYLTSIKSSGFYRFIWDKSALPAAQAETLRLLVGYSDKGPFNTPVYINNPSEFITTFGNISKRLERKGIFFHRLALQALSNGPILALNLKPFDTEQTTYIKFDPKDMANITESASNIDIKKIYNTNRFWSLDPDQLTKIESNDKTITIAATGDKNSSCSIFIKPYKPSSYDLTFREYYANTGYEIPSYMDSILDQKMNQYFAEIYAFRGKFTPELCRPGGPFDKYFNVTQAKTGKVVTKSNEDELAPLGPDGTEKVSLKDQYTDAFGQPNSDVLSVLADNEQSNFINKYKGIILPYFKDANGNYISLDILFNADNASHNMIMKINEEKIETILESTDSADVAKIQCPVDVKPLYPIYMQGYEYKALSKETSGVAFTNAIVNTIQNNTGLRTALTNRVDVDYRYLVDTFNAYPTVSSDASGTVQTKLALLAKEKFNTFAILNFPTIKSFIDNNHSDMTAIGIQAKLLLPSESEGASWCGYFTQLLFSDGVVKTYVPSAALVSNKFMEKYGARQPYYIVAGPTYGVINYSGLVGPDYNYGRADLDILEPLGINVIVYVPRKGTYINSNQTAKQTPVSALSKIHVRELAIYLQDEIEYMLQNYQWELNTQTLRDTIKKNADYLLQTVQNNGGIYAFKTVCDETNNTPEIIDNEMVVLGVEVEPARGAGKMIQTLTIHKTGGLTSTSN